MRRRLFFIILAIALIFSGLAWGSSETTNLKLNKATKGDRNWGQTVNDNMDLIDSAVGTIQSKSDDLPEVYVYTGTFNSTTGYQITLPKSVDNVNEYAVKVTPTSRAGTIGDIYVTKTTSNFTVKCSEANTTDTFSASVYYIGDVSSYGSSIYRKWYVSPDTGITDHADSTQTGSLAWVQAQISTDQATVELVGNKTYQIKQNLIIDNNIQLKFQKGAIIDTDFSIRDSNYQWNLSGSGTNEYYLQASGGGNPNIYQPSTATENGSRMIEGNAGSLAAGEWDWNDNDSLGYSTAYVRLSDSTDPDGKSADYIQAGYTLTINGSSDIGKTQKVFSGLGHVYFGAGATNEVYAQWWGALGDGSQDDTSMFNEAADSITTGVLRIPAGNYKLNSKTAYISANTSETLYGQIILNNNISVRGDGLSSQLHCTLDDTFLATVVVNGTNHTIVSGLYIKGTGTAFSNNYGGGIRVELSGKTIIRDNYIKNTRGIGINYVGNFGGNAGSTGVDYYCAYTHTDNNTIEDCNGDGIYHIFSKYNTTSNNTLDNCGYTDAIILEASDHSTVSNNLILYPKQRGILINTGSSYSTISGNTIYFYNQTGVGYYQIFLTSVIHCTVTGNVIQFSDAGGSGISRAICLSPGEYAATDTYHVVSGNSIINSGATTDECAIHIMTHYNLVTGNNILAGYGICADQANYNMISGNYIRGDGNAIRLVGVDGRDDPDHTYIMNNYIQFGVYDAGTNSFWQGNIPNKWTVTATGAQILNSTSRQYTTVELDSSLESLDSWVKDGTTVGQQLLVVMTDATNSSILHIEHYDLGDSGSYTYDAVDEAVLVQWTGTEWAEVATYGGIGAYTP